MSKKLNGYAKWIGIILAFLVIAFNSGVTYNRFSYLTEAVDKLTMAFEKQDEKINNINLKLAERRPQ